MPSLVFNKCCGCIELRSGCLIIAYLNLVCTVALLVLSAVAIVGGALLAGDDEEWQARAGAAVFAVAVVLLVVLLFSLALAVVLLVGLHQHKRGLVKAYLVCGAVSLVLNVAKFLSSLAGSSVSVETAVCDVIYISLYAYFLLVIRSHYLQMEMPQPPGLSVPSGPSVQYKSAPTQDV